MLVAVAVRSDGLADQDCCGKDLYAPAPMIAETETEMSARALRLSSFPEDANVGKDVPKELLLVVHRTWHYPGS